MRINKFVAAATGISRRAADKLADEGEVLINGRPVRAGREVSSGDVVTYRGNVLKLPVQLQTIILNKPVGYVVSRKGQGSKTVYDLLPPNLHHLKPIGRLDKNSSGLLLLSNDGELAQELTHPSREKVKVYEITLDKSLRPDDKEHIENGVELEDGISRLELQGSGKELTAKLHEGRNRQIRRTFAALGYDVIKLHRTQFGPYKLANIVMGTYQPVGKILVKYNVK